MPAVFDPAVLATDPEPRRDVLAALAGVLEAADPAAAVRRHLRVSPRRLSVGGRSLPLPRGRFLVLAFGKAAPAMAAAALEVLAGREVAGAMASPSGAEIAPLEAIAAGHPLPNAGSLQAGDRFLSLAGDAGPDDLVLVLVSGGGSALAESPLPGLTLEDLEEVNRALLRSGAPITEVNTVRRHLSAFKGGRLAAAAYPTPTATLILSDVVGSPLEAIAGGPTVPDPTTFGDALAVLERWEVTARGARAVLEAGAAGRLGDTPSGGSAFDGPVVVVADGATAAAGGAAAARRRGLEARAASTAVQGEARLVGARLAAAARRLRPGQMTLYAGETTVTLAGTGHGGRNQELALAAGIALTGSRTGALVASFATDGVDGPTDAAGGIGDAHTAARGRRLGLDPAASLAANDSLPYLDACGDLLRCGPTGTNVGDVMVAYRPRR